MVNQLPESYGLSRPDFPKVANRNCSSRESLLCQAAGCRRSRKQSYGPKFDGVSRNKGCPMAGREASFARAPESCSRISPCGWTINYIDY